MMGHHVFLAKGEASVIGIFCGLVRKKGDNI